MSAFGGFKSPFWRAFWDGYLAATVGFAIGAGIAWLVLP